MPILIDTVESLQAYLVAMRERASHHAPNVDEVLLALAGAVVGSPIRPGTVEAQVTHIIDGDTIEVSIDGVIYDVRSIGIDTPETVHQTRGVAEYGEEASAKNEDLVGGKVVELEKDVSETAKYGGLLRYVYVGDVFVNAELVRLGYAQAVSYPPDVKY